MTVDLITDILRWWSVPAAVIAILELKRELPVLYRSAVDRVHIQPVDLMRAFFTALSLFAMCLAIMLAGAIIPVFTDGRLFGIGPESPIYAYGMATAWTLWSTAAWALAASYAKLRLPIFISGGIWFVTVCIAMEALPVMAR